MTERAGQSVARCYAILQRLHAARRGPNPAYWVVSTEVLRGLSPDYALDRPTPAARSSARKLFQRDLDKLAERGLIETGVTTERTPNASGVRYRVQQKPDELQLTVDEHAALQRARALVQPGPPLVSHGDRISDLDVADAAITALMEGQGYAEGPALANDLRVNEARLRSVLLAVEYAEQELVAIRVLTDEEPWEVELTEGALARRDERGLGAIGRFAYTRAEVDERLSVIERASADPTAGARDHALLSSARGKLLRWRAEYLDGADGDGRRRGDASTRRGRLSTPRPGSDVSTD